MVSAVVFFPFFFMTSHFSRWAQLSVCLRFSFLSVCILQGEVDRVPGCSDALLKFHKIMSAIELRQQLVPQLQRFCKSR